MEHKALIGIGSNLGIPADNCEKAIRLLDDAAGIEVISCSSLYESEPVGKTDQNWFVNAAVVIKTSLPPETLLKQILKIEEALGRIRREKWGPRVIDLDILIYDKLVINTSTLIIPHPEMVKRRFVLQPLSECAGDYIHPVENKTIHDLLKALPENPLVKKILSVG